MIEELKPQLLELKESLAKIELNQSNQKHNRLPLTSAEQTTFVTTENLRRSAEKVLSSASTIYSGTDTGGTIFDFRYSSEHGEPLNQARRDGIQRWISRPITETEEEDFLIKDSNPSETLSNPPTPISSGIKQSTRSGVTSADTFNSNPDSDSDAEVDVELVQKFVDKARKHYAQQCFSQAEAWFHKSLQHAEKLSWRRQESLGVTLVRLQYASCCFQQQKMVEAKAALLLLIKARTFGDGDRVHVLQASHLLAHLYLRSQHFDKAIEHCRKAMIGRRRILGKGHPSHYETLSLMSAIYKCRGDFMEAETYNDMIPGHAAKDLKPFTSVTGDTNFPDPSQEYQEPSRNSLTGVTEEAGIHETNTTMKTLFVGKARDNIERNIDSASSRLSEDNIHFSRSRSRDTDAENSSKGASSLQDLLSYDDQSNDKNRNIKGRIVAEVANNVQGAKLNTRTDPAFQGLKPSSLSLTARAAKGNTPLHVAIIDNDFEAVRYHICGYTACDFLEARNEKGDVAMHLAVERGQTPIAEVLLDRGADINVLGYNGCTPLYLASRWGHTESVRLLLDRGAYPDSLNKSQQTPLWAAIIFNYEEIVQLLLDAGTNIELVQQDEIKPLHLAVLSGKSSIVRLLLDRAADINAIDGMGMSPLMHICGSLSVEILQMLLDGGADIHQASSYKDSNWNVLHFVCVLGIRGPARNEIVRVLLKRGADYNKDSDGKKPLDYIKGDERDDIALRDIFKSFGVKSKPRSILLRILNFY